MFLAQNKDAGVDTLPPPQERAAARASRPSDIVAAWAKNPKIALLRKPGQVDVPLAVPRSASVRMKVSHSGDRPGKGHIIRLQADGKCRIYAPVLKSTQEQEHEVQSLINLVKSGRTDWVSGAQFGNLCFERKTLRAALVALNYMKD